MAEQAARQRIHHGERAVDVGGQSREAVAFAVDEAVGRLAVAEAQGAAVREGGAELAAQEGGVRGAAVVAVGPDAHQLVFWIGDAGGERRSARVEEAHRPARLEIAGLDVGERKLGRASGETLLAGRA